MEKLKLTQQKHTFADQKGNVLQHKINKKLKPAWKRSGSILI